jgi:hypothetical protein
MKATPFDPARHLAPIPFSEALCRKALELKQAGLDWEPQVGCFVWDPEQSVPAPSPFGQRIYFVLNLNRFLQFYRDFEELKERLVWLPTWHQARLLLARLGAEGAGTLQRLHERSAGSEEAFLELYELLRRAVRRPQDVIG